MLCALALYPLRGSRRHALVAPEIVVSEDGVTVHDALVRFLPWQHLDGRACRILDDRITLVYQRAFWQDPVLITTEAYPAELAALLKTRISLAM